MSFNINSRATSSGGVGSQLVCNSKLSKALIFFALFAAVALSLAMPKTRTNVNDFVAYWSAASLLIHGQNPYACEPVLDLEKEVGFMGAASPLIMRNPPWIAPIIAPLGFLSFVVAQRLWFIGCLLAIVISLKWLWDLYRVPGQSGILTSLAIAAFSPIPVALAVGQISPLILLGIAGFLRFEKRGRLGWAGALLALVAVKPHLVFLVFVALLLWSIYNRSAKILGMFALTMVMASFIAVGFDHSILTEYFDLLKQEGVLHELTPTLGGVLRLSLHAYVLQFLPAMTALGWLLLNAWRKIRQFQWKWNEQTPFLLLVSLLTAPYAWFFDQVLLLLCIFQSIPILSTLRDRRVTLTIASLYLGANALVLVLILSHRSGFWYAWTVPCWFTLFTVAWLQQKRGSAEGPMAAELSES